MTETPTTKREKNVVKYIFGCRSPLSAGIGMWDDSFVFCYDDNKKICTGARFNKNLDFIGHPSLLQGVLMANDFKKKGWTEMPIDDIIKTADRGSSPEDYEKITVGLDAVLKQETFIRLVSSSFQWIETVLSKVKYGIAGYLRLYYITRTITDKNGVSRPF